ncbi:zinc protease [Gemmatimonadetes bacterium T265]|nr:zinc protease [Gemmatimonadetes bacterium T265]
MPSAEIPTLDIPLETYTLPNGLRVTLSEDHSAPVVAVNLWYHVGSANERAGRTGFAHLFEHMLFQGSANVGANEHFELVQRAGGTLNGSTWLDRTNYFETVPSNQLALALWLEADRMARLLPAMTQDKLDTQRDVVKNERRWSMDNQPYGTWWERLPALAYPEGHPFHHSLIGSMTDLDAASLDDVRQFFATYYTPDNAVLTVAGDFESGEAKRLIEELYGPIPRGVGRPPLPPMELPATFGRTLREEVADDVQLPRVLLAFRIPPFGTEAHYVAEMAAAVLGVRQGSRLVRALVREQQVASDVHAFTYDLPKGADLLVVDAVARPGVSAAQLEAAVAAEVERMRAGGVTAEELERARALVESGFVVALQSAGDRADQISRFACYFGDPSLVNAQVARYQAVTAEQVTAFAREQLSEDNRAYLVYVPRDGADAVSDADVEAEVLATRALGTTVAGEVAA